MRCLKRQKQQIGNFINKDRKKSYEPEIILSGKTYKLVAESGDEGGIYQSTN